MTEPAFTAENAIASAGAALWSWNAAAAALTVRADTGGPLALFDGHWRIEAFLELIDGLSRAPLATRLHGGRSGDLVDVRFTLSDGRPAHFVGSFSDDGVARGLIVSAEAPAPVINSDTNVEPVFQPIRRLDNLSVAGFEALARFRTPDGRLVGAETLVGRGGETDWLAIAPVMLRKSAEALSALRAQGRDIFMQVNLSAAEIARPTLVEEIAAIIRDAGLPQGALRVELTEQAALRDYEGALGALSAFRAAGAGLVLDDFGAGHSSFAWLAELPADGVKLDPRLSRIARHQRGGRIVAGLVGLIHDLGMFVIAEGVEDRGSEPVLRAMGCDYVQGFAWDMPLRAPDIAAAFDPLP
jgi:EAL domain-containing protein (putative c-di-GMP-specific phosphodiesterase class I)